uniref:(northern house mosquito) hypothetical protein n=1 Tax=Culex pipiens TaxID=7175 RepID=A0A8D8D729_CULPI
MRVAAVRRADRRTDVHVLVDLRENRVGSRFGMNGQNVPGLNGDVRRTVLPRTMQCLVWVVVMLRITNHDVIGMTLAVETVDVGANQLLQLRCRCEARSVCVDGLVQMG